MSTKACAEKYGFVRPLTHAVFLKTIIILMFCLQSEEFDVYINYANTYREAVSVLENLLKNDEAVEYLEVQICMMNMCGEYCKCMYV